MQPIREIVPIEESHGAGPKGREGAGFLMVGPSQASPSHAPGEAGTIEPFGIVLGDAREENIRFPRADGRFKRIKLLDDRRQAIRTLHVMFGREPLPFEQETQITLDAHRLNFSAQTIDREPVDAGQQPPLAPFQFTGARTKFAAKNKSFRFQRKQGLVNFGIR